MHCRFLALAVLSILALVSPAVAVDPWDTPDNKWRLGPVKYLLTKEEDQEYKKLKTDEERKAFVDQFWAKRDYDPKTPENEYRDLFYQRAREAASQFTEDNGKGWQDDRGKVYILLGRPDEIKEESSLLDSGGSGGSASRMPEGAGTGSYGASGGDDGRPQATVKTHKFVYRTNPLTGKAVPLELSFRSEVTGGFRLDEKIDWSQPALRGLVPTRNEQPVAAAKAPVAPPPSSPASPPPPPEVPPAVGMPPVPEVTPQSDLMQQIKTAAESSSTIPLDVTTNFYKAAKGTLATLTLEVKRSALPAGVDPASLVIAAELLNADSGESEQRFFKQEHFGGYEGNKAEGATEVMLFQAQRPVTPGRYKAIFAVKDPASGAVGRLEKALEIPNFESTDLALSTVTLAHKLEPLVTPPPADKMTPFVLGNFEVVPKPDTTYKSNEEVTFYYQIYNATPDPATSTPRMELSYTVAVNISGKWRVLGGRPLLFPGQTLSVQAYKVPLANRPPGEYKLIIAVTDNVVSPPRTATSEVHFQVVGPGPSKAKAKSKG